MQKTLIKLHSISKKRESCHAVVVEIAFYCSIEEKALLPLRNKNGRNSIAEVKEAKRKKGFWARRGASQMRMGGTSFSQ